MLLLEALHCNGIQHLGDDNCLWLPPVPYSTLYVVILMPAYSILNSDLLGPLQAGRRLRHRPDE